MTKKVKYTDLLKQSLTESADTSKTSDVVGPMLEPILGFNGSGKLETYKSASNVLQKYYFEQDSEKPVELANTSKEDAENQKETDTVKKDIVKVLNKDGEVDEDEVNAHLKEGDDNQTGKTDEMVQEQNDLENTILNLENILLGEQDDSDAAGDEDSKEVAKAAEDAADKAVEGSSDSGDKNLDVDKDKADDSISELFKISENIVEEKELFESLTKMLNEDVDSSADENDITSLLKESAKHSIKYLLEEKETENCDGDGDDDDKGGDKKEDGDKTEIAENAVMEWLIMEMEDFDTDQLIEGGPIGPINDEEDDEDKQKEVSESTVDDIEDLTKLLENVDPDKSISENEDIDESLANLIEGFKEEDDDENSTSFKLPNGIKKISSKNIVI